jgi:hypothetical protein
VVGSAGVLEFRIAGQLDGVPEGAKVVSLAVTIQGLMATLWLV